MRAPTPYPKELKALAKHARNLQNVKGDSNNHSSGGESIPVMINSADAAVGINNTSSPLANTSLKVRGSHVLF